MNRAAIVGASLSSYSDPTPVGRFGPASAMAGKVWTSIRNGPTLPTLWTHSNGEARIWTPWPSKPNTHPCFWIFSSRLSCSLPATSSVSRTITRCFVPRWKKKAQTEPEPGADLPVDPSRSDVAKKFPALPEVPSSPGSPDARLASCRVFCAIRYSCAAITPACARLAHPPQAIRLRLAAGVTHRQQQENSECDIDAH
jgi:hypothetical protein